jgi:hypothetical protein
VACIVYVTRQVIQTNGLASGSSLLQGLEELEQSCHNLSSCQQGRIMDLVNEGEETIKLQATRASNSHVPGVHVHKENAQFSTDQLMEC